jgi:hypothetical protein
MAFSDDTIRKVWEKGTVVPNNDSAVWRKDSCSAWMQRSKYGDRTSTYGWEVDHIDPNGGDGLANLQPLQWENNVKKGDGKLVCAVKSSGNSNVTA